MKLFRFVAFSLLLSLSLSACSSTMNPTTSLQSDKSSTQQTSAIASTNQQSTSSSPAATAQPSQNDQPQVQASSPSTNHAPTTKESQNDESSKQSSVQAASNTTAKETTKETTKENTEVKAEAKQEESVKIISVTSPAARNSTAILKAKVTPNATASIVVHYKSGASKAAGLESKKADANGNVSWSWHVGGNTTIGTWRITVSSGNASAETSFQVVH
jgi:hypothetical protein